MLIPSAKVVANSSPIAFLAQSVERTTLNRVVVGSIPTEGAVSFCIAFFLLAHSNYLQKRSIMMSIGDIWRHDGASASLCFFLFFCCDSFSHGSLLKMYYVT